MTKKITALLLSSTLTLGVLSASAQTAPAPAAPAAPDSSWVFTPALVSEYMFRGVRLGGFSFEPTVEFDSGNLAVGVWANFPLADKVPGTSDPEIDPYASYKIVVNDSFNVQPGFTWYNYPNAEKKNGFYKSSFEPSLALNCTVAGVTLTPKIYYDVVLKGPTLEFTGAYAFPLKDAGTELDFTGTIGTYKWTSAAPDQGADVKNYGNYWLAGVSAPFQITKASKLTIGWAYTKGSDNFIKVGSTPKVSNGGAIGRGVVTASYSVTF